jgi:hypothetical protein
MQVAQLTPQQILSHISSMTPQQVSTMLPLPSLPRDEALLRLTTQVWWGCTYTHTHTANGGQSGHAAVAQKTPCMAAATHWLRWCMCNPSIWCRQYQQPNVDTCSAARYGIPSMFIHPMQGAMLVATAKAGQPLDAHRQRIILAGAKCDSMHDHIYHPAVQFAGFLCTSLLYQPLTPATLQPC